ncbi:MAG: hypothetical protein WDO17_15570 [Alphaproteobacteria bacterium]
MASLLEVMPVPDAVKALVQPPDHNTGYFAPVASDMQAIKPLEARAMRAQREHNATVVMGDAVEAHSDKVVAVLQALSRQGNAIILYADCLVRNSPQIIETIDEHAAGSAGYLNLVFREKDIFSAPYFHEAVGRNRCRQILVAPTLYAAMCGNIMNLVDAHFGDVDAGRRAEFQAKLARLVQGATLDWTSDRVIEPRSGLEFYPVPEGGQPWPEFAATLPRYSRDPCGFLLERFDRYIECGLLYSGHLRHAHRELYDAIRFSSVNSLGFDNVDAFFAHHGILIAADLADPALAKKQRVETILDINTALAGRRAVLGHAATHGKRSLARRTAASATDPK